MGTLVLTKQELRDTICMRYVWKIDGIPTHYVFAEKKSRQKVFADPCLGQ